MKDKLSNMLFKVDKMGKIDSLAIKKKEKEKN